jgi:prophage antirepressor-like protein
MQNALITYAHDLFGTIRTLADENGEPLFVASDIAKALGYRNAPDMTRNIDPEDAGTQNVRSRSDNGVVQSRSVTVINESGLYAAIFASRLQSAKGFKRWVTSVVLPAIRKDGAYVMGEEKVATGEMSEDELVYKAMLAMQAKIERLSDENAQQAAVIEEHLEQVTVDEWRALNHCYMEHSTKVRLGQWASKMTRALGQEPVKQPRTIRVRGGEEREVFVNVYPRSAIDDAARYLSLL